MRLFGQLFLLSLKRLLRKPAAVVFFLLALALTAAVPALPGPENGAIAQVGLVLPPEGGQAMAALLQEGESRAVRYILTDEETAEKKVLSGQWDCALLLAEDFDWKLEDLETRQLMTLLTGPGSTVYPLVQEHAAACVMQLLAEPMAAAFLEKNGVASPEWAEAPEETVPRVDIRLQTLEGAALEVPALKQAAERRLLLGTAAVLLLLWGLYLAGDLGRWLESGTARRLLAVRSEGQLLLPQLLAQSLPLVTWGGVLAGVLDGFPAAAAWLSYSLAVMGITLLAARCRPLWQAVPVCAPFLAAACFLLEPVLLDVEALFPVLLRWGRWRPVTLFMKSLAGDPGATGLLALEAAVLLTLGRTGKRRWKKGKGS